MKCLSSSKNIPSQLTSPPPPNSLQRINPWWVGKDWVERLRGTRWVLGGCDLGVGGWVWVGCGWVGGLVVMGACACDTHPPTQPQTPTLTHPHGVGGGGGVFQGKVGGKEGMGECGSGCGVWMCGCQWGGCPSILNQWGVWVCGCHWGGCPSIPYQRPNPCK